MLERRRHHRVSIHRLATVQVDGHDLGQVRVVDISESGLSLIYRQNVAPGTRLQIRFRLGSGDQLADIDLHGVVRHTHISGQGLFVGIEFDYPPAPTVDNIRQFVESRRELHRLSAGYSPPTANARKS